MLVRAALLSFCLLAADEDLVKPDKLTIHTWVREDLFAGWMVRDDVTFEKGVQKLARYLQDKPEDRNALAWQYMVESYRMRAAAEKNDDAAYAKQIAAARALRERIFAAEAKAEAKNVGPHIIVGGSLIHFAWHAKDSDREWMYRDGRELLSKVPAMQGQMFDKLPSHMRGELWSQVALASDRLGDKAERDRILDLMLVNLQGTPYEARAKRWKALSAITNVADNMCISCHEPGRLKPTMARLGIQ